MKIVKLYFLIVLPLVFYGCASVPKVTDLNYTNYRLGIDKQANIGDSMVTVQKGKYVQGKKWVGLFYSSDGWEHYKYLEKGSYKKELIYTGTDESKIKISYREYLDDLARPAFYHDLTYDLNKSNTIVFRNFKIQVFSADNEKIHFLVLNDQ